MGDWNKQPFALLLRVTQSNGKPLPIAMFTGKQCLRCYMRLMLHDQEVVKELEEETSIMKVSKGIHGLFHWGWTIFSVDSLVAKKNLIADMVREHEVGWERQSWSNNIILFKIR